jgi:hypothetical protein
MAMSGLDAKSLRNPDETRPFEKGKADIVTLGDFSIGRTTLQPDGPSTSGHSLGRSAARFIIFCSFSPAG